MDTRLIYLDGSLPASRVGDGFDLHRAFVIPADETPTPGAVASSGSTVGALRKLLARSRYPRSRELAFDTRSVESGTVPPSGRWYRLPTRLLDDGRLDSRALGDLTPDVELETRIARHIQERIGNGQTEALDSPQMSRGQAGTPAPSGLSLSLTFIDVEHGDGILIQMGSEAYLFDLGSLMHPRRWSVDRLDAVCGGAQLAEATPSHPDFDHCCGLVELVGAGRVDRLNLPNNTYAEMHSLLLVNAQRKAIRRLRGDGTVYDLGNQGLRMHSFFADDMTLGANEKSLLATVHWGDTVVVLPGDFQPDGSRNRTLIDDALTMLRSHLADTPAKYGIYKVSHHGSPNRPALDLYPHAQILEQDIEWWSAFSCGSLFGNPGCGTVGLAASRGRVVRTDYCGTVTFHLDRWAAPVPWCRRGPGACRAAGACYGQPLQDNREEPVLPTTPCTCTSLDWDAGCARA